MSRVISSDVPDDMAEQIEEVSETKGESRSATVKDLLRTALEVEGHAISFDLSDDMAEQVEELREEGESSSATVKRLLRAGIKHEEAPGVYVPPAGVIAFVGLFFMGAAFMDAIEPVGFLGLVFIIGAIVYTVAERRGW